MADFAEFVAKLDGRRLNRVAVLTFAGTWAAPGTGYPSNVVSGLTQYVNPMLCYEVPVQAPWSFGPIMGPIGSPSYQESVSTGVTNAGLWMRANPNTPFVLDGYSQGGEAASRVAMELMDGNLKQFLPNFAGGVTFGNPSRGKGFHAPTIADPGPYRGISPTRMTRLPVIDGEVVWADYVHSPANGDAGLDMYPCVPDNHTGDLMEKVYLTATELELHDFSGFTTFMVNLWNDAAAAIEAPIDAIGAAIEGMKFVAAPGGPTAPHTSYLGEIPGYSNQVADAVGFLERIATKALTRLAA